MNFGLCSSNQVTTFQEFINTFFFAFFLLSCDFYFWPLFPRIHRSSLTLKRRVKGGQEPRTLRPRTQNAARINLCVCPVPANHLKVHKFEKKNFHFHVINLRLRLWLMIWFNHTFCDCRRVRQKQGSQSNW